MDRSTNTMEVVENLRISSNANRSREDREAISNPQNDVYTIPKSPAAFNCVGSSLAQHDLSADHGSHREETIGKISNDQIVWKTQDESNDNSVMSVNQNQHVDKSQYTSCMNVEETIVPCVSSNDPLSSSPSSVCCPPVATQLNIPSIPSLEHHYWGTSYHANDPCEDRFASMTNILLQSRTQDTSYAKRHDSSSSSSSHNLSPSPISCKGNQRKTLFRVSMFCVFDGHGGPTVAEYSSSHLLPMLRRNICQALDCECISKGDFQVSHLDMAKDCRTTNRLDRGLGEEDDIIVPNQEDDSDENEEECRTKECNEETSWYSSPRDGFCCPYHSSIVDQKRMFEESDLSFPKHGSHIVQNEEDLKNKVANMEGDSNTVRTRNLTTPLMESDSDESKVNEIRDDAIQPVSFSPICPSTTHQSKEEQEKLLISNTLRETILQLDESWINTIRPLGSRQSYCVSDGKCNAGSCCLVVLLIQKSDYSVTEEQHYTKLIAYPPSLYTSHLGDCRAIMLQRKDDSSTDCDETDGSDGMNKGRRQTTEDEDSSVASDDTYEGWDRKNQLDDEVASHVHHWTDKSPTKKRIITQEKALPLHADSDSLGKKQILEVFQPVVLTNDHTPYNQIEASLVRRRCNNAPHAISIAASGGIQRVAGSLSVTRALGDAYLKAKLASFFPYKNYVPYITACPEISVRTLTNNDRMVVMGTDGVWERVDGKTIAKWVTKFFLQNPAHYTREQDNESTSSSSDHQCDVVGSTSHVSKFKRKRGISNLLHPRSVHTMNHEVLSKSKVSDVIVWKILNKVRRMRRLKSIRSLMAFPPGRARRLRHDDITACVVDLSGFADYDFESNTSFHSVERSDATLLD